MAEKQVTILAGDVRTTLKSLPDESVHCVVTSPPYWALRSYLPSDHPLKSLELGSEPTPTAFVENLVGVFREVRRVLRSDGTVWVNIGDTYAGGGRGENAGEKQATNNGSLVGRLPKLKHIKSLDQCLVPHQFAAAMRADGWYLRDTVVWAKPSAMPVSVDGWTWARCKVKAKAGRTGASGVGNIGAIGKRRNGTSHLDPENNATWRDCPGCPKCNPNDGLILRRGSWRTTTSHEYIFLFAKTDNYYADRDAVSTPAAETTVERNRYSRVLDDADEQFAVAHDHEYTGETANLRSVWIISSEPTSEKHYAAYPTALAERCILASTSAGGVCAECGAPLARVVEREQIHASGSGRSGNSPSGKQNGSLQGAGSTGDIRNGPVIKSKSIGFRPTCQCKASTAPAVVLDPFGGTGRTAIAAIRNGRRAILCELNPASVEISSRIVGNENPLFGAVEVVEHSAA